MILASPFCFNLYVFTDGSVDAQLKVGYGACLLASDLSTPIDALKDTVKVRKKKGSGVEIAYI